MKIADVVLAVGTSGYFHKDMLAIKAGAKADGFLFHGPVVQSGLKAIVEPATVISIMLVLDDGQIAFGDCADVIFAGVAGRDPVFHANDHLDLLRNNVRPWLIGRQADAFRANAEEMDVAAFGGRRLHTAVRYGLSQALLQAASLAKRSTMAEVIAGAYGTSLATQPIPILVSCPKDDPLQLDRMVLKRAALLPHAAFTVVADHVGQKGEKLEAYAHALASRIRTIAAPDYRPRLHLDLYGTLGELFGDDLQAMASYLRKLAAVVQPYDLLIESPIIARTQKDQIECLRILREMVKAEGGSIGLIADEWCNTLDDVALFADAQAADYVQIKTPDLGSLTNTIEAILRCKQKGMGACLGGTANETDQSARICTHIGLACGPDFMLSKPGLGGDEALMIQQNEMSRTFALIASRKCGQPAR
jgi:methylaspartate ammonia-lyase